SARPHPHSACQRRTAQMTARQPHEPANHLEPPKSVNDHFAAEVAGDFYAHLTDNGKAPPQPDRSANALHHATRRLRARYPNTPSLWAAYTHTRV
ncbi:hypothetical protein ACFY2M_43860, partial [Streptomyces sp. NPDC001276]|uniref:hypothetical protein n=1 Tax=Streptomyces sp. NPDC001276 TaxID=3364555 RepID=UPI0036C71D3B